MQTEPVTHATVTVTADEHARAEVIRTLLAAAFRALNPAAGPAELTR